jgi:hypothetical protein
MATTTYSEGSKIQAGWISTDQVPLAADTYYKGMLLEYTALTDTYDALAAGSLAAIYNGEDGRVLAAAGTGDVIVAGEVYEEGLVDDAGDALTLTEDQRALYRAEGFYIKRK